METLVSDMPWSTVWRVDGGLWRKQCKGEWMFEPALTAALSARWPDRVTEVVDDDADEAWLLTRDAGRQLLDDPEPWPALMRSYAELQQGEVAHVEEHVAAGVPDLRLARLPERYAALLEEVDDARLQVFEARFVELCDELAALGIPETIQHDDLHQFNVYVRDDRLRILDWGDSGITGAFLDAWGGDERTLALALRVGRIAHAFKLRPRDVPDDDWPRVVALAVAQTLE